MQHKLIMTWDITPGKEQEYFDFLIHTYVPRMKPHTTISMFF